jgi:hypothetical protein
MGDATAKAKSVDDSIANLEKYSFKTLEYSNKMLAALNSIKTNTDGLTVAILQAGINIGTNPDGTPITGTTGTSQTASDLLKGLAKPGSGITKSNAFSFVGDTISKSISSAITSVFGSNSGIGKAANKITGWLVGGGTTTSIEDMGIQVNGMITAIAKSADGLAQSYTNVKTVTKGGLFHSDKTNLAKQLGSLGDTTNNALVGIFSGIIDTVTAAGDALGKDPKVTKSLIDGFNVAFQFSAQGLDAKGIADALTASIGVQFNKLATLVFPELDKFRLAGEEMGTALVRLARDTQVVSFALDSIGMSFKTTGTLVEKVGITENLIKLAGGLDTFTTQTDFFKTNFLTATEQIAPVQDALTKELTRMGTEFGVAGLASMNSREQFAKTVKGLDLTTEAGQKEYVALMNVADAFSQVYTETRIVATASELLKSKLQQQIEIFNLEGKSSEALTIQRQDELAQMDERLRAGQLYIYALQDEATLKGQLKTAYDAESAALTSTINTLGSGVKTLNAYKLSLNMGSQSNLSPQEKYAQAKSQAESVAAIANSIVDTTKSKDQQALDTQAKNDAINQLPSVSTAFLDASRAIYASSSMYNQDYSYIQDLINTTTATLGAQQTDAQLQLDQLKTQVGALIDINANIATTNEILTRLETAQQNINATQPGAAASGLTVGNITTTTTPIESLFSNLTQRVKDLSDEIAGLRADQQAQTQDIVVSNATTQAVAADTVVTGITAAFGSARWRYDNNVNYA